jgi:ribosomal protein S18 acetylase RimI-like enzyme
LNNDPGDFEIASAPQGERDSLEPILDECFTGLYLRHARRTLAEVETVMVAHHGDAPVGLAMLKPLAKEVGYVYYIAVLPSFRGKGVGARLLIESLDQFSRAGAIEVYASVGEDNAESKALFLGRGFRRTDFGQVSKKYGVMKALSMYRSMLVVPGEIILVKDSLMLPGESPPNPSS